MTIPLPNPHPCLQRTWKMASRVVEPGGEGLSPFLWPTGVGTRFFLAEAEGGPSAVGFGRAVGFGVFGTGPAPRIPGAPLVMTGGKGASRCASGG